MPSRPVMRMIAATHEFWYRMTGGFVGGRFGKAPILLLTTTGAKTGKERTMPLLYYPDGENLVVIASNGGSDRHPGWYVNVRKNPKAEVQVGRETKAVTAKTASAEEKARLWPLITKMYAQYDGYQKNTSREIPVVVLKPAENA